MSWINDRCSQPPPPTTSEERARGIIAIHRSCEPPCPRKLGALPYLPVERTAFRWLAVDVSGALTWNTGLFGHDEKG